MKKYKNFSTLDKIGFWFCISCFVLSALSLFPEKTNAYKFGYILEKHELFSEKLEDGTDLNKLAKAVAIHETKDCTLGNSAERNNCFGIMQWDENRNRSFKEYKTKFDSYEDFKRIWKEHYGSFPDKRMAEVYSGNDRADAWLYNVSLVYHSL